MSGSADEQMRKGGSSSAHLLLSSSCFHLPGAVAIITTIKLSGRGNVVLEFFRRRKLSGVGEKRLVVALARAEETIIEAHVECALEVIEALGEEMPIDRVLELYLDSLEDNPRRAEIIARRVLTRLNVVPD